MRLFDFVRFRNDMLTNMYIQSKSVDRDVGSLIASSLHSNDYTDTKNTIRVNVLSCIVERDSSEQS